MGDSIMQWEKEDLCLASSYAPNCAKSQLSKPFFASFAGSQDWYFSCPHAGQLCLLVGELGCVYTGDLS